MCVSSDRQASGMLGTVLGGGSTAASKHWCHARATKLQRWQLSSTSSGAAATISPRLSCIVLADGKSIVRWLTKSIAADAPILLTKAEQSRRLHQLVQHWLDATKKVPWIVGRSSVMKSLVINQSECTTVMLVGTAKICPCGKASAYLLQINLHHTGLMICL